MWNGILDKIFKERQKADYDKYKKSLEHVVKVLTRVLEEDDTVQIIAYGECFRKAFGREKK